MYSDDCRYQYHHHACLLAHEERLDLLGGEAEPGAVGLGEDVRQAVMFAVDR